MRFYYVGLMPGIAILQMICATTHYLYLLLVFAHTFLYNVAHSALCTRHTPLDSGGQIVSRVTCSRGLATERSMITSVLLLLYSDAFFALSLFFYFFYCSLFPQTGTATHSRMHSDTLTSTYVSRCSAFTHTVLNSKACTHKTSNLRRGLSHICLSVATASYSRLA